MMVLAENDDNFVVEGYVTKLFKNPRKTPTKDGMTYWQALILGDETRIHYYGHIQVEEGHYVRAEMSQPKTGQYPRCNSLQIVEPPAETEAGQEQPDDDRSEDKPETAVSEKLRTDYHPFEQAKMRMNAGGLARSLHETAVQSARRNDDGSLDPDSYKEYLSMFSTEMRNVWKRLSAFNYGEAGEDEK